MNAESNSNKIGTDVHYETVCESAIFYFGFTHPWLVAMNCIAANDMQLNTHYCPSQLAWLILLRANTIVHIGASKDFPLLLEALSIKTRVLAIASTVHY